MLRLTLTTLAALATYHVLRARDLSHTLRATERERNQLLRITLKHNEEKFLSRLRAERTAFV